MKKLQKLTIYTFRFLFVVSIFAQLLDTYRSNTFVETNFITSSNSLLVLTIVVAVLLRLRGMFPLPSRLMRLITFILTPLFLITAVFLIIIDQLHYVNFIYDLLLIQMTEIFNFGLFFLGLSIIFQPDEWYKKHYKKLLFWSPLVLFVLFYLYGFLPFSARWELGREDGIIENLTAVSMLIASYLTIRTAHILFTQKRLLLAFIFFIAALGSFAVAGEEISWGQRIFHYQPPEFIMDNNVQKEMTLHNHNQVAGEIARIYTVIGFYGAFAWIPFFLSKKLRKISLWQFFVPQWFLFFFFFSTFVHQRFLRWGHFPLVVGGEWSELSELMLSLGVMFHFLYVFMMYKEDTGKM